VSQLTAIICVPIIVTRKVIGIVYVDSGNMFAQMTQEDVAFTAAVAHELALTIVNIRLQQSAIRNERMAAIGLTVSNLAHNIKNLTMINQNAIDLMKMHLDRIGDAKTNKCWEIIQHGFHRINKLSAEMLAYASEKELSPASSDINLAILANTDYFDRSLKNNGIQLSLALSDENPRCMIDEQQLQDALLNIVVNAVDAIGNQPDGKIHITTAVEDGKRVVIAVRDNGCGINPVEKQKIFDLFYTTKGTNGSGLGLPMVVKFIEASGGKLLVASEPGVGSTFKMVFPLQK
jgi:signal transduction histidine kinase